MTKEEVLMLINAVEKQYKGYKDGGGALLVELANEFYQLSENDKRDFCSFLIDETEYDSHGLCSLSICLLKKIGKPKYAEGILEIFKRNRTIQTIDWKMSIVELLISLDYLDENFFYSIVNDDFDGYQLNLYYIIVQYCAKTPLKGISMLSAYYLRNLLHPDFVDLLTNKIYYLYAVFIKDEFSYLSSLIDSLFEKNKRICRYFVLISIDFLESDLAKSCSSNLSKNGLSYLYSMKEQCK